MKLTYFAYEAGLLFPGVFSMRIRALTMPKLLHTNES